jgi:hypothetical protein
MVEIVIGIDETDFVGSVLDVAVMVTLPPDGTAAGVW